MIRNSVLTPSGRRFAGRWPQDMPQTGEGPYIAALARTVHGACEVVVPLGRADVANASHIYEVEPVGSWRSGARQVLAYAWQTGLTPALALFGPAEYERIYLFLRDRLPGIDLWVWRDGWERTTSRASARRKFGLNALPASPEGRRAA